MTESNRVLPGGIVCLPSVDPLLCPPDEKAERETRNTLQQLDYIQGLIERGAEHVRESHVHEFHRLAVQGIFPCAGSYRTLTRTAELRGGDVTHVPPEPALIGPLVNEALDRINGELDDLRSRGRERVTENMKQAIDTAAYALWRFNWIHPFAGGNGRTARAIAYLVMTIDFGHMIPGTPSMPTYIASKRKEYEAALRKADDAALEEREDLASMFVLVGEAMAEQLKGAIRDIDAQISALSG